MKEIRAIVAEYDQSYSENGSMALATVYEVKGSSYRRSGARMLIKDDGNWFGGISGGCIEGNALKQANMVMSDNTARLVTYDTENDDESSIGISLGCNGLISIIIAPISGRFNPVTKLKGIINSNEPVILLTVLTSPYQEIPPGSVLLKSDIEDLPKDSSISGEEIIRSINSVEESKKSMVWSIGDLELFIELIEPDIHLIIMGGNYDVYPLLEIADNLGWRTTIIANSKRLFGPARKLAGEIKEDLSDLEPGPHSVGIVMAHDYAADLNNLKKSLDSSMSYIGVLGPAVRRNDMISELEKEGYQLDKNRIFGPAGLDIGAVQPEEIAISIISEIIAFIRSRNAGSLRERESPIHER